MSRMLGRSLGRILSQVSTWLLVFGLTIAARSALAAPIEGGDLLTGEAKSIDFKSAKLGTVVVFMSSHCPCSASHEPVLKELAAKYPDFRFVGIHSNTDESAGETKSHFQASALPFAILQDSHAKIANELKAFKTPHAFIFNPSGEKLYEGGVTDSHVATNAHKHFLADALEDIKNGQKPRVSSGRTLGCVIARD